MVGYHENLIISLSRKCLVILQLYKGPREQELTGRSRLLHVSVCKLKKNLVFLTYIL